MTEAPDKKPVIELIRQAEAASAEFLKTAMENDRGILPPNVRAQLAGNVARLLERAKAAGISMRDIAVRSGVAGNAPKPENTLATYRVYENGKRTDKPPRLQGRVRGYLSIAKVIAESLGMAESDAILELAQDVSHYGSRAVKSGEDPAERICALLRTRLQEIQLSRGLDDYFQAVKKLRVLPEFNEDRDVVGWEFGGDGYFDFEETRTWPCVLLTAVEMAGAPGRMWLEGEEIECQVSWVEKAYLAIGADGAGIVRPYLELDTCTALNPTEPNSWNYIMQSPWLKRGYPPPSGIERFSKEIVFEIRPGHRVAIPQQYEDKKRRPDPDPYGYSTIKRLDAQTLVKWFVDRPSMLIQNQSLPIVVDEAGLLAPTGSTLALLEGVLLGRKEPNLSAGIDFLQELDRQALELTYTFNMWRARRHEEALAAHRKLLAESEQRVAELSRKPPQIL